MKKILPIFFSFLFVLVVSLGPSLALKAYAAPCSSTGTTLCPDTDANSRWVIDPEVTFIGKNAARSGEFLNWTLQSYNWVCVKQVSSAGTGVQCDDTGNPIAKYWSLIVLYIVVPMLFVVILATSMVIIITRGKSLTIMRFIPRFIAVVLLIVFSYSLLQFLYQFTDLIQGFFLRSDIKNSCPPACISDKDLLYVGWDYNGFVGLRLLGDKYAESAFISLLLTKLTALTYFVMVFLLLVRKIILWFFIIISPIFPILLLYYPVRNTGKIWIGEFFRWLLYAPLFAIFLNGLVYLWRSQIPLVFPTAAQVSSTPLEYPTAVNILLGGPQQQVSPTNSINLVGTFALYVVSLIMLWVVIILPWILLQIFLDYAQNFAPGDTAVMKTLVNMASSRGGSPSAPQPPSEGGAAVTLPFAKKFSVPIDLKPGPTGVAKEINAQGAILNATFTQPISVPNATVNAQVLNASNVKLPSMRDIARFDVAITSHDITKQVEVSRFTQQLVKIANPVAAQTGIEKTQMTSLRERLSQQSKQGNVMATSIMNAANASSRSMTSMSNQKVKNMLQQMANPATAPAVSRDKMTQLNTMLKKESSQNNNQLAASILSVNEKTSEKEIQSIKDRLSQASHSQVSKAVTSTIAQTEKASSQVTTAIKQVANPTTTVKSVDKERVAAVRKSLEKASKEGNQLAASILSVNEKTSTTEIEALQQKIQEAKDKGEPIATELTSLAATTETTTLPTTNRVQNVSKEDYQAVKDMWKQNYQNLEVPQGMAGNRSEWIKDDIAGIDETIALLSSPDQEKVQQGMDQVSNLLPFLLVGGFSKTEIVDYLKAKQDAAKEVSKTLAVEEEDKVSVQTHHAHAQRTLAATMEEDKGTSVPSSASSGSSDDSEEESPLTSLSSATATISSKPASDVFSMSNIVKPKMTDIAKFEVRHLTKDKVEAQRFEETQKMLEKIANPAGFTGDPDHTKIEELRQKLSDDSSKGDSSATSILSAATSTTNQDVTQLASSGKELSKEEYEEVKKLWLENYLTLPVPEGYTNDANGRTEWIKKDSEDIQQTIGMLQASDTGKQNEGLKHISSILPFLLLGGFSLQEMTGYLQAKFEAGTEAMKNVTSEEESKVAVAAPESEKENEAMTAQEENKDNK